MSSLWCPICRMRCGSGLEVWFVATVLALIVVVEVAGLLVLLARHPS